MGKRGVDKNRSKVMVNCCGASTSNRSVVGRVDGFVKNAYVVDNFL